MNKKPILVIILVTIILAYTQIQKFKFNHHWDEAGHPGEPNLCLECHNYDED